MSEQIVDPTLFWAILDEDDDIVHVRHPDFGVVMAVFMDKADAEKTLAMQPEEYNWSLYAVNVTDPLEDPKYVIYSPNENASNSEKGYWSEFLDTWVERELATVYTDTPEVLPISVGGDALVVLVRD